MPTDRSAIRPRAGVVAMDRPVSSRTPVGEAAGPTALLAVPPAKVVAAFWHDGLLRRPRLTELLEPLVRRQRLCLLVAPAGYGKTVLLVDLVRQTQLPQVWLRLGDEDCDVARLAISLRAAIDHALPEEPDEPIRRLALAANGDPQLQMVVLAHRLSRPPREWLVVLDDLHSLEGSQAALRLLGTFLRSLPDFVHVVAACRRSLPQELAGLYPEYRIATLGPPELRFTTDEAEAFLTAQGVPVESWPGLLTLLEQYEGWPAVVPLLAQPDRCAADARRSFEQLAVHLVASLPPEERAFLECVAQLERITVPLCQECLAMADAHAMLGRLVQHGVFLAGPDAHGEYRLHSRFRDYLVASTAGASSFQSAQHLRAAEMLARAGDRVRATRHLIAGGDLGRAEFMLAEACQDLARTGQFRVMLDLLQRWRTATGTELPPALVRWQAHAMTFVGDWRGAVAETSRALQDPGLDEASRAGLLVTRSFALLPCGDIERALDDIRGVLAIGADAAPRYSLDSLRALAGQLANQLQLTAAQERLEEALALARAAALPRDEATLLAELSGLRQMQGELATAVRLGREAERLARELGLAFATAAACNNLAIAYHALGRYDDAAAALRRGKEIARQGSNLQAETVLWLSEGDLQLDLARPEAAELCYSRAMVLAGAVGLGPEAAYAHLGLCHRHRIGGDLAASRRHLEAAAPWLASWHALQHCLLRLAAGMLAASEGGVAAAADSIREAVAGFQAGGAKIWEARARLALAYATCLAAGIEEALPELEALHSLVAAMGEHHFLIPEAARMPRLWAAAASIGRRDLCQALSEPDLRPWPSSAGRGLPPGARYGDPPPSLLSPREREIVIGLCDGLSREAVGLRLGLSLSTINKAISNMYAATGFEKTHQLVAWAHRCGLYSPLEPPPPQIDEPGASYTVR